MQIEEMLSGVVSQEHRQAKMQNMRVVCSEAKA
jgi:hypothetical protein